MNKNQSRNRGKRQQPRKDSRSKRVNFDNERVDKLEKDFRSDIKRGVSNDPIWYARNAELMKSAASLPFSQTTGMPLPWSGGTASRFSVPGIMTLQWRPSIGGAFIDPINQAANSTYSYVVHANSRNKTYDAPDLMIMILCGASLFSMLGMGIRAYGVMRTYDQRNSYLPSGLIQAMGFDYQDLKSNLPKMWFDLNELISRSKQIWVPNSFPFIERWFWMNTNVYIDAESIKAQYYMYTPYQYLVYNETGDFAADNHVAEAQYKIWFESSLKTWNDYIQAMNTMFDALLASQDRGIVFGDILKAYGESALYALPPITSDYQVIPVYDKEVLTQIENATTFNSKIESISQDPNTNKIYEAYYTPTTQPVMYPSAGWLPAPFYQVLNFHQMEDPTPEQIMVATRLKAIGVGSCPNDKGDSGFGKSNSGGPIPLSCGTEVVQNIMITIYDVQNSPLISQWNLTQYMSATTTNAQCPWSTEAIFAWASFDWAPWLYAEQYNAPWSGINTPITNAQMKSNNAIVRAALGDYDYYTIVNAYDIEKMHRTAIYSEFGVPTL